MSIAARQHSEDLSRLRINVTTMGDLLLTAADRNPDKLALVFPETRCTYAELAARAACRRSGSSPETMSAS
jgi:non-ribosomal peptide synthetase component E (peptide arylation enzyme)